MSEQFKITREKNQHYHFEVKNETGQFLFNSIAFLNKKAAKATIEQLRQANANTLLFERKTNYEGKFHFNLKTNNSGVLGKSGLFQSKAGMENGINQMKNYIATLSSSS